MEEQLLARGQHGDSRLRLGGVRVARQQHSSCDGTGTASASQFGNTPPSHLLPHDVGFPCPEPCSTHLGWFAPPAACALRGHRHLAGAAPPRAPTPETLLGGGRRLGRGQAGAEHPHRAGHPLRRQHGWGRGHPHPSAPPPEQGQSHLRAARGTVWGRRWRCCSAAAPTAACPGPPVSATVWWEQWCCLGGHGGGSFTSHRRPQITDPASQRDPAVARTWGKPTQVPPHELGDRCLPRGMICGATSWWLSSSCKGKQEGALLTGPGARGGCWAPVLEHPKDLGDGGCRPWLLPLLPC